MIWRFLLGVLSFLAFWQVFRGLRAASPPPSRPERKTGEPKRMVQDPQCGTFIPMDDALPSGGETGESKWFCSPACRDAYRRAGSSSD